MNKNYINESIKRAVVRKNPWNLILIPISILAIGFSYFLLFQLVLAFQHLFIPKDIILLANNGPGCILMYFPIFFTSMGMGLIITNLFVWCFPFIRNILDKEAEGVKGASFKEAMRELYKVTAWMLLITLPISLIGAMDYFYITNEGIHVRPILSLNEKFYDWNQVKKINIKCEKHKRENSLIFHYDLIMDDDFKVDIASTFSLRTFVNSYKEIKPFISEQKQIVYNYQVTDSGYRIFKCIHGSTNAQSILKSNNK